MFNLIPLAGAAVTLSYLYGSGQNNTATSHTFTSVPFGSENPERRILVVQGANASKSTCTVASNSASLIETGNSGASSIPVNLWMLHLATGTSGSIVVSGSNSRGCIIHVYSLVPASDTLVDTIDAVGGTINTQGCVVAGALLGGSSSPLSVTWTNMTEDGSIEIASTVYFRLSVASRVNAPSSLTLSPTGTETPSLAAAAFKPF